MATARSQIPVTNLKERIAALEQRNAGINATSRPTSPTPSTLPAAPLAPGFRDKIAKFERKGGVPVPRGSFGLGAPPTSEGPRRRGELYGNRIPQPARAVSGGTLSTASRASSPTTTEASGVGSPGDRRSFSMTSVMSDFDEGSRDYTPITSPTFAFPPDSPESVFSMGYTPQTSPTLTSIGDVPALNKPNIVRGTSFQKAMEIARNAEAAKLENQDLPPLSQQFTGSRQPELSQQFTGSKQPEPVPSVIVSSEGTTSVVTDSPPAAVPSILLLEADITPGTQPEPESRPLVEEIIIRPVEEKPGFEQETVEPEVPPNYVTPLNISKRSTDSGPLNVTGATLEEKTPVPSENAPIVVIHTPPPSFKAVPPSITELDKTPTVVVHAPFAPSDATPTVVVHGASPIKPILSTASTVSHSDTPSSHPAPAPETNKEENGPLSANTSLTLDTEPLANDSVTSPLDTGDTSTLSLTDMLGDFFTGKAANGENTSRPTTPPPKPSASPMSPYATLAYDGPETPEKEKASKPATIDVPDPQAFLSPPPTTGLRSSAPSSGGGSSLGSLSSLGSPRPMSMIETSQISRAMRMTPATGRGVPMFLPPTSAAPTRQSDFVYFPPTPVEEEFSGAESGHKASQSVSLDARRWASESTATFTAVVHEKVQEVPATVPIDSIKQLRVPVTPQMQRLKRMTIAAQPPPSPGRGELEALLQGALLLEDSLDRGELPAEVDVEETQRKEAELRAVAKKEVEARKTEEEERARIAAAAARLQAKRDEPTEGRLKHTFLVPLTKARSVHRKEASAPAPQPPANPQDDPFVRPKSAGVPEKQATRPVTPDAQRQQQQLEAQPKSAKTSRFAGFRRLGSISARPNTIHGHSSRTSTSTMSSDSAAVVTPPEGVVEFGSKRSHPPVVAVDEFGGLSANGSTTSFPSLSPKKSASSIGRAASFAERVFSRTRTKSSGSQLSTASEMTDRIPEDAPSLPSISIGPFTSNLHPIPDTPAIVLPVSDTEVRIIHPPKRSTSLARSSRLPPLPAEAIPPLPAITPSAFFSTTVVEAIDAQGAGSLLLPATNTADATRPSSWTSMSSAGSLGSLPSPLFDKALFDAFPSVPDMTPTLSAGASNIHNHLPRHRSVIDQSASYEMQQSRPSFDSDLLSSAIHLANTRKSTAPIVAPPAGSLGRAPSSRATTPTPAPRRSGETAR